MLQVLHAVPGVIMCTVSVCTSRHVVTCVFLNAATPFILSYNHRAQLREERQSGILTYVCLFLFCILCLLGVWSEVPSEGWKYILQVWWAGVEAIQGSVQGQILLTPFMLPCSRKVDAGDKIETLNVHPLVQGCRHDVVTLCAELCLYRAVDFPTELL